VSLDSLLAFRVGRRTVLTVAADPLGGRRRDVAIRPRTAAFEKQMLSRA
jgi:hypothetical protein